MSSRNTFSRSKVQISACSLLAAGNRPTSSGSEAHCDDWVDLHSWRTYDASCWPSVSGASEWTEHAEPRELKLLNKEPGTETRCTLTRDPTITSLVEPVPYASIVNRLATRLTPLDLRSNLEPSDPPASMRGHQERPNAEPPSITRYLENTVDSSPWNPAAVISQCLRESIWDMPFPALEVISHLAVKDPIRNLFISLGNIAPILSTLGFEPNAAPTKYPQMQPEEHPRLVAEDGIAGVVRASGSRGTSNRYENSISYDLTGLENPLDSSRWVEYGPGSIMHDYSLI